MAPHFVTPCPDRPWPPPRVRTAATARGGSRPPAWLAWLTGLLVCFGLQTAGLAADHVTARGWLEDPSGALEWPAVQSLPTTPYQGTVSRGFGHATLWLKLRIDPSAHPAPARDRDRLVLRIRPVYLDDIRVYDPLVPGGLAGAAGDQRHPAHDAFQALDFNLPLARGTAPRDVWLRINSTSTRQVHVQALSVDAFQRRSHQQALAFAVYIGLVLVLAVWGVAHWLFRREAVIGAFALAQCAALGYALLSLGYARVLWPASWPPALLDHASSLLSVLAVSTALLFHVMLQRDFSPPRWARLLHGGMLALLPVKLLLLAAGLGMTALQLNLAEVMWSPAILLGTALASAGWRHGHAAPPVLARPLVIGFYGALLVLLLAAALPGLGLIQGAETSLYIVHVHGLVAAFLIMLMLLYRAHVLQERQKHTQLALERSQVQAQQERAARADQDQLLTMLAHELKTPLSTIQLRLDPGSRGAPHVQQAITDMNSVIERCLQANRLTDGRLQVRHAPVDLPALLRDAVASCARPAAVVLDGPAQLELWTDRQLLMVVLNNLLENACKYAAADSPLNLSLAGDPRTGWVQISLANRPGTAGWPDPQRVFEKFYRSPHAQRQTGTGLGLFLARNLVHTLGGALSLQPDPHWVRFVVRLPHRPRPATRSSAPVSPRADHAPAP